MTGAADPRSTPQQFRKVLGHFPTGVTIVTGLADDEPAGFTIGSFTSISLDPPLVGFLPQVASDTWQAMAPPASSASTSSATSRPTCAGGSPRAASATTASTTSHGRTRPPAARSSRASGRGSTARSSTRCELGDHYFVVGRVVDLDHHGEPHVPLVFYKGALGGFSPRNSGTWDRVPPHDGRRDRRRRRRASCCSRRSAGTAHDESSGAAAVLTIAAPFLVGLLVGWIVESWRPEPASRCPHRRDDLADHGRDRAGAAAHGVGSRHGDVVRDRRHARARRAHRGVACIVGVRVPPARVTIIVAAVEAGT